MSTPKKPGRPKIERSAIVVAYLVNPIYDTETESYATPSGKIGTEKRHIPRTRAHSFQMKKPIWDERDKIWRDKAVAVNVRIPCRTDKCEARKKGFTNKDMMTAVDELIKSGSELIGFQDDKSGRKPLAMEVVKLYEADIAALDSTVTVDAARAAHDRSEDVEKKQNELREGVPSSELFTELKGTEVAA